MSKHDNRQDPEPGQPLSVSVRSISVLSSHFSVFQTISSSELRAHPFSNNNNDGGDDDDDDNIAWARLKIAYIMPRVKVWKYLIRKMPEYRAKLW
jgi:hypothetical protein